MGHAMNESGDVLKTKCGEKVYLKDMFSNQMMENHLLIVKIMTLIMLTVFTIVFFLKLIPVLAFLICPMFQIKVGKMLKRKPSEVKDSIHISQKSANFNKKVAERRRLRELNR
jgi:hypothetical protein